MRAIYRQSYRGTLWLVPRSHREIGLQREADGGFMRGRAGGAMLLLTCEITGRLTQLPPSAALQLHNYRGGIVRVGAVQGDNRACVHGAHIRKHSKTRFHVPTKYIYTFKKNGKRNGKEEVFFLKKQHHIMVDFFFSVHMRCACSPL